MKSDYELLGVTPSASDADVKKAYRSLAMKHHPDRGGDPEMFKNITRAFESISKFRTKEKEFDRSFQNQRNQWSDEIYDENVDLWGRDNHQERDTAIYMVVDVSLASTLRDQVKIITVEDNKEVSATQIEIPRGISNDESIRYSNLVKSKHNRRGRSLHVTFRVRSDSKFDIDKKDKAGLISDITVDCFQAIAGTKVPFTGIDKKKFMITVPPGTQPNTVLNLREQGLYRRGSASRGDLKLIVKVTIPAIDTLSNELQNLILPPTKKG